MLVKDFDVMDLHHIPRADNTVADGLSTMTSTLAPVPDGVFERRLRQPIAWAVEPGGGGETSTSKLAVLVALIP
jgi:hypothetical protein